MKLQITVELPEGTDTSTLMRTWVNDRANFALCRFFREQFGVELIGKIDVDFPDKTLFESLDLLLRSIDYLERGETDPGFAAAWPGVLRTARAAVAKAHGVMSA